MSKNFYIEIDGERIPVSEDVYYTFKRPAWRERKRRQVRAKKELSLEAFSDESIELPSKEAPVDEIVEDKLLLDMLIAALSELSESERGIIDALFFDEKTEREVAHELGVSQSAINQRRNRILEKLKKFF